ncbi:hypothetical protein FQN54_002871 [Arachnomyces sp. PD_36]|nr:hypothetical protein FQN54_002871 [Arachnomyces sp. PD_36]
MTMFNSIAFLNKLGYNVKIIHAGLKPEERADVARSFNDPDSKDQILVTSFACAVTGLNLHGACSDVVLLEPSKNYNTDLQAIMRVHRVGQKKEQKVWILFQDHTYDRIRHSRNTRKMINP